jgi:chromosome segregation ATPase
MSGVSIDTSPARSQTDLDTVFDGGQAFLDRISEFERAKKSHDKAAKNAADRISAAEQRERESEEVERAAKAQAEQIIADANAHGAEMSRLIDAARKQLDQDRGAHARAVAKNAAEVTEKLVELGRAKQEAEQRQQKLDARLAKLDAALVAASRDLQRGSNF